MVTRQGGQRWLATRGRYQMSGEKQFARFDALAEDSTLAFSDDGSVALDMTGRLVRRWRLDGSGRRQVDALPAPCHGSSVAALSVDGSTIAVAANSQVYLCVAGEWRSIEEPRLRGIRMVKFSVDGRTLMIGGTEGLSLYDLEQHRIARRFKTPAAAVAADMRNTGAIAVLTEAGLVYLVGSGKPVVADLARIPRDRLIGTNDTPAIPRGRVPSPSVTFSENFREDYPEDAALVVCGLPGAAYVLKADTLKSGVAIAGEHAAVGDNANMLVTRGERILDYCLEDNHEFEDDYY
jgi:hypothetical protein